YPHGAVVSRTYTGRDELDSVSYAGGSVATFIYDAGMRRTMATFGNGLVETRAYQNDNRVFAIQTPGINAQAPAVTDFSYAWDANKRKLNELDAIIPGNEQCFVGYDANDRLTDFVRGSGCNGQQSQSWGLSLAGDWNSFNNDGALETRVHDA